MKVTEYILSNLSDAVLGHSGEYGIPSTDRIIVQSQTGTLTSPQLIQTQRASSSNTVTQQGGGHQSQHGGLWCLQAEGCSLVQGVHSLAEEEWYRCVGNFSEDKNTERRHDCLSYLGIICRPDVAGQCLE